jgi:hypothetical protein
MKQTLVAYFAKKCMSIYIRCLDERPNSKKELGRSVTGNMQIAHRKRHRAYGP